MARLGAKLVLRLRRVGDAEGFAATIPVWPLWAVEGGLSSGDLLELVTAFTHLPPRDRPRGAIVTRPAKGADSPEALRRGICATLCLGTDGPALREALSSLTAHMRDILHEART